jgi:hypothetical protein
MKKRIIVFAMGVIAFSGCNDKPEVQPANYGALSVYPNPATYKAYISVGRQVTQAFTLQVFDTKGQVILEEKGNQGLQNYSVNLKGEPVGNYQIILVTNNKAVKQKLIKIGE